MRRKTIHNHTINNLKVHLCMAWGLNDYIGVGIRGWGGGNGGSKNRHKTPQPPPPLTHIHKHFLNFLPENYLMN